MLGRSCIGASKVLHALSVDRVYLAVGLTDLSLPFPLLAC